MTFHTDRFPAIHLGADESLMFQTRAGCALITTSGSLVVTGAPGWLAGQMYRARLPLEPGVPFPLDSAGWISLQAGPQGGTAVWVDGAAAPSGVVRALLQRLAGWASRRNATA